MSEESAPCDDPAPSDPPRRAWFERRPINLGELLVETFAVVFGILLALWINDWHNQRQEQATVRSALRSIRAEIALNQQEINKHHDHMQAMAKAMLDVNRADDKPRPCTAWTGWDGLQLPTLLDSAYQVSIATQALANMPFEQARGIAATYGQQRFTQKVHDVDDAVLVGMHPLDVSSCAGTARDMARTDENLDRQYAKMLTLLDTHTAH